MLGIIWNFSILVSVQYSIGNSIYQNNTFWIPYFEEYEHLFLDVEVKNSTNLDVGQLYTARKCNILFTGPLRETRTLNHRYQPVQTR